MPNRPDFYTSPPPLHNPPWVVQRQAADGRWGDHVTPAFTGCTTKRGAESAADVLRNLGQNAGVRFRSRKAKR